MLYPSIQQLTNDKINRYALVMGTAKCARHVTDLINQAKEQAELNIARDIMHNSENEAIYDKAVNIAIKRINEQKYIIKLPE